MKHSIALYLLNRTWPAFVSVICFVLIIGIENPELASTTAAKFLQNLPSSLLGFIWMLQGALFVLGVGALKTFVTAPSYTKKSFLLEAIEGPNPRFSKFEDRYSDSENSKLHKPKNKEWQE